MLTYLIELTEFKNFAMLFPMLVALMLAVSSATAIPLDAAHDLRTTATTIENATVYAYGKNISGLPVLVNSNGIAYVSAAPSTSLWPVIWTMAPSGAAPWTATQNSSNGSTTLGDFYVITTAGASSPVGFASNGSAPSGAETLGFVVYGSDIVLTSGSTYQEQFWATPTNTSATWEIVWNESGADIIDSAPVILKITPPTS